MFKLIDPGSIEANPVVDLVLVGIVVGLGVGQSVGLGVGLVVGFGVGLGFGLDVGLVLGLSVVGLTWFSKSFLNFKKCLSSFE